MENNIRFNLSASYEDAGWVTSVLKLGHDAADGWTKKFSDCRGPVDQLNAKKIYKLIKTEIGTYLCCLLNNAACSRNGKIQLSLFVPSGYKFGKNGAEILNGLVGLVSCLPVDNADLRGLFENNTEVFNSFKEKVQKVLKNMMTVKEDVIQNFNGVFTGVKSGIAYRKYKDDGELCELLSNLDQEVYTQYSAVYFVEKTATPDAQCIEIKEPLQHVFCIEHGTEKFYILENNELEIKLNSYKNIADVMPRTLKVKVDGKDVIGYQTIGRNIYIHEEDVKFTRNTKISLLPPIGEEKSVPPRISVGKAELTGVFQEDCWVYSFERDMFREYDVAIHSEDYIFKHPEKCRFSLKDVDDKEFALDFKRKYFEVVFVKNNGRLVEDGSKSKKSDNVVKNIPYVIKKSNGNRKFVNPAKNKYEIVIGETLTLSFDKHSDYELEDKDALINISDINDGKYIAYIKNKELTLVTYIGGIKLSGETNKLDPKDESFAGCKLEKDSNERIVEVVAKKWKTLAIAFLIASVIFLISTIVFVCMFCMSGGSDAAQNLPK